MITLTERAAEKIKKIASDEGVKPTIRMVVKGGGCAGFQRDFWLEELEKPLDESFTQHDVTILVDPLSLQYLDGTEIDVSNTGLAESFKFTNANVTSSCGCGSSFSVD